MKLNLNHQRATSNMTATPAEDKRIGKTSLILVGIFAALAVILVATDWLNFCGDSCDKNPSAIIPGLIMTVIALLTLILSFILSIIAVFKKRGRMLGFFPLLAIPFWTTWYVIYLLQAPIFSP